ncbi:MAG TPA: hypothetical protein VJX72_01335 [Candidatus Acidoferrum sp.]|nr:hypothetical protein [Candidatus Acidoferrum sp.]
MNYKALSANRPENHTAVRAVRGQRERQLLRGMLFGVQPLDWRIFALVALWCCPFRLARARILLGARREWLRSLA